MHRLFVAIQPPPDVRDRLLAAMGGIAGARWQRDDQLHLTLRFIGEVDRHQGQDIAAALAGVRHAPFELALAQPGIFDRRGRIDSLWIGVTPHDQVRELHVRVDQALRRVGVAPDGRSFLPHITIARFSRGNGVGAAGFVPSIPLSSIGFRVEGFTLFESSLGSDGADYRPVEIYRSGFSPR